MYLATGPHSSELKVTCRYLSYPPDKFFFDYGVVPQVTNVQLE